MRNSELMDAACGDASNKYRQSCSFIIKDRKSFVGG